MREKCGKRKFNLPPAPFFTPPGVGRHEGGKTLSMVSDDIIDDYVGKNQETTKERF